MTARNESLDIAKGLGILLVVLGHNWLILGSMGELLRVVYSFHLPLFFVLSGVFLKRSDSFGAVLRSKADSLLKPYVVVLGLLGVARFAAASPAAPFDAWQYALGVAWGTGSTLQWVPLWFLPHLFLALFCAHLIIAVHGNSGLKPIWLFVLCCALLWFGMHDVITAFWRPAPTHPTLVAGPFLPGLPWSLDLAPVTIAFILLGHLFREPIRAGVHSLPWVAVALTLFTALHALSNNTINLNERACGQPVICSLQAAAGICLTLFIASRFERIDGLRRPLAYLGQASLIVLIFHRYFQDKVYVLLSGMQQAPLVYIVASYVAGVLGPLLIWELARRNAGVGRLLLPRRAVSRTPRPARTEPAAALDP